MIYTKKQVTTSRTGRQYENTCKECSHLLTGYDDEEKLEYTCHKYPAMGNMVRCIDYTIITLASFENKR